MFLCIKFSNNLDWSLYAYFVFFLTNWIQEIAAWQKEKNAESRKRFRTQMRKKTTYLANATNTPIDVRTVDLIKHVAWRTRPHEIRVRENQNNKTISNVSNRTEIEEENNMADGLFYIVVIYFINFRRNWSCNNILQL